MSKMQVYIQMGIFEISDVHCDYEENLRWVQNLSQRDFNDDLLILAGDISHSLLLVAEVLEELARRFAHVLFVSGNHDL
jgi:3',5'-cyclic AMP phosphodiesterase CpdA